MPTYLNSSNNTVFVGLQRIEPGQTISTVEWLTSLPAGVTLLNINPILDPVILSQKITATSVILIPTSVTGNYRIRVYVATGDISLKLNDESATPIFIGLYDAFDVQCLSRTVNALYIVISSGTAYVTVTKI